VFKTPQSLALKPLGTSLKKKENKINLNIWLPKAETELSIW